MKNICFPFGLLPIAIFLTSCLGPKKIDRWISEKYAGTPRAVKTKHQQISIVSNVSFPSDKLSETTSKTSHMLPLILYWQFDYNNTCVLNPGIATNIFETTVSNYGSHKLIQKLSGGTIELTIKRIPAKFSIDDKGHLIFLIYAFTWDYVTILPEETDLLVSYKVLDSNNQSVKNGEITISGTGKPVDLHMFQSLKKKTWGFLDQYDADMAVLSKKFIDRLLTEF